MKIITFEEHYCNLEIREASQKLARELCPDFARTYDSKQGLSYSPPLELELDIDEKRILDMDAHGIDMQILSCLSTQQLPKEVAVELVAKSNDLLAKAVEKYPSRFKAFAALPTSNPKEAAIELKRCIKDLGFVGAMINGRTNGLFLDHPDFDCILEVANQLHAPIYLHPGLPPKEISELNYQGLDPKVSARFETCGWGWHDEAAIQLIHLILSGIFDRYPNLQIIVGHWGEMIPFFLTRLETAFPIEITKLNKNFTEYFKEHIYITPSGIFDLPQLQFCLQTLGADRILYSVDYPYIANEGARDFLENAPIDQISKEKIAYINAEELFAKIIKN